ncbi:MAG: WG repeat-containing protein, partial [Sphaerospermopsis kisseleviana]
KFKFNEGLTPVMVKEGGSYIWGFIDKTVKMIIEPQFSYASDFSEGLAVVVITDKINPWNQSVVFINKTGEIVIQAQFFNAHKFKEGLAAVKLKVPEDPSEKGSRWITIDKNGQSFVEKWGFIDKTGKIVIQPQFVEVDSFSEGLAKVAVFNNEGQQVWGFIDRTGKIVINPQFADVKNFKNGLAAVSNWTTTKSRLTGSIYHHKSNFGFIDKTGKEVIPPKFSELCPKIVSDFCLTFNNDLAFVVIDDNQIGYINKKGEFIWSSSDKKSK